jgi:hypothetical protein
MFQQLKVNKIFFLLGISINSMDIINPNHYSTINNHKSNKSEKYIHNIEGQKKNLFLNRKFKNINENRINDILNEIYYINDISKSITEKNINEIKNNIFNQDITQIISNGINPLYKLIKDKNKNNINDLYINEIFLDIIKIIFIMIYNNPNKEKQLTDINKITIHINKIIKILKANIRDSLDSIAITIFGMPLKNHIKFLQLEDYINTNKGNKIEVYTKKIEIYKPITVTSKEYTNSLKSIKTNKNNIHNNLNKGRTYLNKGRTLIKI